MDKRNPLLVAECLVNGATTQVHSTTFVDDLGSRFIAENVHGLEQTQKDASVALTRSIAPSGLAQHEGKAEGLVTLVGAGPMKGTNHALQHIPGTRVAARYLGPHFSYDSTVHREVGNRIAATYRAWYDVRSHWSMYTPFALSSSSEASSFRSSWMGWSALFSLRLI